MLSPPLQVVNQVCYLGCMLWVQIPHLPLQKRCDTCPTVPCCRVPLIPCLDNLQHVDSHSMDGHDGQRDERDNNPYQNNCI